jgi:alpha-N-arabinofuranosidase
MNDALIVIDKEHVAGTISPRLYGGLVELIGEVVTGGLHAEMIRNRKFANVTDISGEGVPINWAPIFPRQERGPVEYLTSYNSPAPGLWSCCLLAPQGQKRGICQSHLDFEAECLYKLSFYFRTSRNTLVQPAASLADEQGEELFDCVSIGEPDAQGWRKYSCRLRFPRNSRQGQLRIRVQGMGAHMISSVSLMPDTDFEGMRLDVIEELRKMGLKVLRFPGGCAAEAYDWRNGIGPRDLRPAWLNPAWKNVDDMDTGTDEICRLAEFLGAEVHLTVNISTLSEEVAAQWVEYCNGSTDTEWGRVRAANGHPEPYGVKLWGLGNEANSPGFPCEHAPEDYVSRCDRFMAVMLLVDPALEFVLVGGVTENNPTYPAWDREVLNNIYQPCSYHAVHLYTGIPSPKELPELAATPDDLALACAAAPVHISAELQRIYASVEEATGADCESPKLYFEEWGLLSDKDWETDPEGISEAYNLHGALFVAGVLNSLLRLCGKVGASNVVFPTAFGYVFRDGNAVHVSPAATVMGLHEKYAGTHSYIPVVSCSNYESKALGSIPAIKNVPYLDVAVSADEEQRTLAIMVINRHPHKNMATSLSLKGFSVKNEGRIIEVSSIDGFGDISDWYKKPTYDSVGDRDRMTVPAAWCAPKTRKLPRAKVQEREGVTVGENFHYVFPAHSFTIIVCELK